jgi:succinoglycan biosynthesis transport protein ExoP
MNEWAFYTSLRDLLYLLFSYKRVLVISFLAVFIPTLFLTCSMTPVFETKTQILVETEERGTSPLGEEAPVSRPRQAVNEMQIIVATPVLEAVINRLDLLNRETGYYATVAKRRTPMGKVYRAVTSAIRDGANAIKSALPLPQGTPLTPEQQRQNDMHDLMGVLRSHITTVPIEESQIFEVYFECKDAQLAEDINNTLAQEYLRYRQELNRQAFSDASATISTSISDIDAQIASAESRQRMIMVDAGVVDPADASRSMTDELSRLETEIRDLRGTIGESQARYEALRRQLDSGELPEFVVSSRAEQPNPGLAEMLRRRSEIQAQLQQLRNQYPDDARLVLDTQRELEQLQRQIENEPLTAGGAVETQQRNPIYTDSQQQTHQLSVQLAGDQARLESLLAEKASTEAKITRWRHDQVELESLRNRLDGLHTTRERLQANLSATGVAELATDRPSIATIRIFQPASLPLKPTKPKVPLYLMMGAVLGIVLGLSIVSVYAYFDHSVKSAEMAEREFALPVLATLPDFGDLPGGGPTGPLSHGEIVRLGLINSYRGVAQRLLAAREGEGPMAVLVTSALEGEGVSTVLSQLGAVIAHEQGLRVVLVDCRHRARETHGPRVHDLFGDRAAGGLFDTDVEREPLGNLLRNTNIDRLRYVAVGEVAGEALPTDLGARVKKLVKRLESEADLVLIDTPPVVAYADFLALAPFAAGSVLVVEFAQTKREIVSRALANLSEAVKPVGLVLNRRRRVIPEWLYRYL